ncbi:MAG: glycosyltransferase family 2 protein [Marinifilaceae bacterium]
MINNPLVSVILPVYNGAEYLARAIDSILQQSYENFELIILNDGSSDNTQTIIESYSNKDKRVKFVNRNNKGLIYTLNEGFSIARGKYIARHDDDDYSYPKRFEKQVAFMESNLDYALCGTQYNVVSQEFKFIRRYFLPESNAKINEFLLDSCFGHGTVMLRKTMIDEMPWYQKDALYVEDYEFFIRIAKKYKVHNIPEVLYDWTFRKASVSMANFEKHEYHMKCVQYAYCNNVDLKDAVVDKEDNKILKRKISNKMGDVYVLNDEKIKAFKCYFKYFSLKNLLKIFILIIGRFFWIKVLEVKQRRRYVE